jgi:Uma2 family endonuclease
MSSEITPAPAASRPVEVVFPTNLPETDGEPMDSDWHRQAMNLLIEILRYHFRERQDFFVSGNMFIYFSAEQVRNRDYRGPDVFFVWGVDGRKDRPYWAVWEEGGRYPNVIIELLSPTTEKEDRTTKKTIYEKIFRTPEYFLYDPYTRRLEGWHFTNGDYEPMEPDERGWLWSRQLELYLGTWEGSFQDTERLWLRFFDVHGRLILIGREDQQQRADLEKQRADAAEKALAELQTRLKQAEGQS